MTGIGLKRTVPFTNFLLKLFQKKNLKKFIAAGNIRGISGFDTMSDWEIDD